MLYRERFHLSAQEMTDEPTGAVEYWLAVEAFRNRRQREADQALASANGQSPTSYDVPLAPEDM